MPSGEKYALKVAKEVQSQLLVPDSMRVLSARAVNATQEDQESDTNCLQRYKTWVLIYYAAENKGGGTTDDYAIGKITLSGSLEIETPYSEYDIYAATEHDSLEMQTANAWFNLDKYAVEGLSDSMELDADIINNAL